jgi:hypothetical protein
MLAAIILIKPLGGALLREYDQPERKIHAGETKPSR